MSYLFFFFREHFDRIDGKEQKRMLKATNIKWDIDLEEHETYEEAVRVLGLPNEIILPDTITEEDEISDYVSEVTGFCHDGFLLESVDSETVGTRKDTPYRSAD